MKKKKCSLRLIVYELKNVIGNPFTTFFGIVFPIVLLMLITKGLQAELPPSIQENVNTSVFITMSMIVPLAVILLGYAASYSQELEKEIPERMQLFGYKGRSLMLSKMAAQAIALTVGLIIYTVLSYMLLDLEIPKLTSAFSLIVCLYLIAALLFIFAHGLSNIFRKFGPTYAVAMGFYFGVMIICGMMGIKVEQLPQALQYVASLLPMSYVGNFIDFWQGGSYNFGPLIQAYLFFGAMCGLLLLCGVRKIRRRSMP